MQRGSRTISRVIGVAAILSLLLPITNIHAQQKQWWQGDSDGWFFYDDPEKAVAPQKKEPVAEPKEEPKKEQPVEKPLLASEQLKKKGEELLSNAVTNPTEENVKAYMVHNKQMLEMSDRFSLVWQAMLMKYPELYKQTSTDSVTKETEDTVKSLRFTAALLFIYTSTCEFCQKTAPVIAEFQRKYDFTVLPVTMDGIPLEVLPNTVPDNGISARLGIETVPAIYLAYPGEDRFERISTGFLSLTELERKIYQLTKYQAPSRSSEVISP